MIDLLNETNPFSTCRVRPGAIPYFFPAGGSIGQLMEQLRSNGWWGQIVGPHGSGKSTLLAALVPKLQQAGLRPVHFQLHDNSRRLPRGWCSQLAGDRLAIVVIDGYEKIRAWDRFWIRRRLLWRHTGLLITAHESVGLPDLCRTEATLDTAQHVLHYLLKNSIAPDFSLNIGQRLAAHHGNLREVLFDLYDDCESSRSLAS